MGWDIDYAHGSWWAFEAYDGQLMEYDDENHIYDHIAHVSEGLSDVDAAQTFVPTLGYRFRLHIPDGSHVYYDPRTESGGT